MKPEDYAEKGYFLITISQYSKIKKSVYLQHHRAKPFRNGKVFGSLIYFRKAKTGVLLLYS
jgi:hypothetical protein